MTGALEVFLRKQDTIPIWYKLTPMLTPGKTVLCEDNKESDILREAFKGVFIYANRERKPAREDDDIS